MKNSKALYRETLLGHLWGHLNGNGFTHLFFPSDSSEPFSLLENVRQRMYFEDTGIAIEDIDEEEKIKVWFFKPNSFQRVNKMINTNEI